GALGPVLGPGGHRDARRPVPDRGGRPRPGAGRVPALLPGSGAGAADPEDRGRPRADHGVRQPRHLQNPATAGDTSAMEHFVTEWLGALIDYDAEHGTPLLLTLSEYLDSGGSYDASAK